MKKRILSVLIAVVMLIGMLPTAVFAVETAYDIWVGGVQVTSANKDNIVVLGATGKATYDPATSTLTLNNFSCSSDAFGGVIYVTSGNITIKLKGNNKLTSTGNETAGIYSKGDLVICNGEDDVAQGQLTINTKKACVNVSSGTLEITDVKVTAESTGNYGLSAKSISLSGVTLSATGGWEPINTYSDGAINIENSTVKAYCTGGYCAFESAPNISGTFAVYAGDDEASAPKVGSPTDETYTTSKYVRIEPVVYDLWVGGVQVTGANLVIDSADNAAISGSATLTNIGVDENDEPIYTLTLKDFEYEGAGYEDWLASDYRAAAAIYCGSSLIILLDGDSVIAHSDTNLVDRSCGIASKNGLIVSDAPANGTGTLTVAGGAGYTSAGLYVYAGVLAINDGIITATAYEADESSCPIISNFGDIIISGGEVNAHGGDTIYYSFGLIACYGISISDATVNATTNVSEEIYCNAAIYGFGTNVEISNSTVTANAIGEGSAGIVTAYDLSISSSTVTATGDTGIYVEDGDLSISGSTVTATGDTGIYVEDGDLTINGGELKATASISGNGDMGIVAGSVAISDGMVEVMGDYSITTKYGVTIPEDFIVFAGNDAASASIVTTLESGVYLNKYIKIVPPAPHTVTVDYGIDGVENDEIVVVTGQAVSLEAPVIDGYIFMGWYADENFTTAFDFDTPITAATTIYAKLADYEGDKKTLQDAIDALETAVDTVETALNNKVSTDKLTEEVGKLNQAIADAKTYADTQDAVLKTTLEAADNTMTNAIDALKDRVTEIENQLRGIDLSQIAKNKAAIEVLTTDLSALNTLVNTLQTNYANADANLQDQIDTLDAKLTELNATIESAKQAAIDAAKAYTDTVKTELLDLIDTKANTSEVTAKLNELSAAIDAAEATAKTYTDGKVTELTDAIETAKQAAIDAAKAYTDTVKTELVDLINTKANTSEVTEKLNELSAAIDTAEATANTYTDGKVTELTNAIETAKQAAIDAANEALDNAKNELQDAIESGDDTLSRSISSVRASISAAKSVLQQADADNKAELEAKIEAAESTLDAAIKAVQKNLDDAKAELNKAIADGDTALEAKITALNEALAIAKAELDQAIADGDNALYGKINAINEALAVTKTALEAIDEANKLELEGAIDDMYKSITEAYIKAMEEALADLESKTNANVDATAEELTENTDTAQTIAITATAVGGTSLISNIALIAWALIKKKRLF